MYDVLQLIPSGRELERTLCMTRTRDNHVVAVVVADVVAWVMMLQEYCRFCGCAESMFSCPDVLFPVNMSGETI